MGAGSPPETAMVRRTVVITNRLGLHARAAAKFVKTAGAFEADIEVGKNGILVSGKSILGLMMLAAGPGDELELRATGSDAAAALQALANLVGEVFDDD